MDLQGNGVDRSLKLSFSLGLLKATGLNLCAYLQRLERGRSSRG